MIIQNCPTFWELKDFLANLYSEKPFLKKDSKNRIEYSLNGGEIDVFIRLIDSGYVTEIFLKTWSGGWGHLQSSIHFQYDCRSNMWICEASILEDVNGNKSKRSNTVFDVDKNGLFVALNNFNVILFAPDIRDKRLSLIIGDKI
jgi:hypothetical protein